MAGGKVNRRGFIKASSILEVVIAMVIILVVFGIAMTIFTNVMRMSLSGQKIKAQAVLQEYLLKAEQASDPATNIYQVDDLKIEQVVKPYSTIAQLNEVHLTALDENGEKIAEVQKIIISKND